MRLLLFLLLVSATVLGVPNKQRRWNKRIKQLQTQLTLLQKDFSDLKTHVAYLNNTLHTSCGCGIKHVTNKNTLPTRVTNASSHTITEARARDPFYITKISRRYIGPGTMYYRVKYFINSSEPLTGLFSYWNLLDKKGAYKKLKGTWYKPKKLPANTTARVITQAGNETSFMFVFGAANIWYVLHLNSSGTKNMISFNVPLPELMVAPKEVVYDMGQNASFQVQISKNLSFFDSFSMVNNVLTRVGTQDFVTSFDHLGSSGSSVVFLNDSKTDLKVANVTMAMKDTALSGVMTLRTQARDRSSLLLNNINTYKRVVIRPSNQSGPFHQDLFVFHTKNFNKDLNNGSLTQQCELGSQCNVQCPFVVGSNRTKVVIWHKDKRDRGIVVTFNETIDDPFYVVSAVGKIPKGVDEYFCNATRLTPGKHNITITSPGIKIEWVTPPQVVMGQILLSWNGSSDRTLRVTCLARGKPVPSLFITVSCPYREMVFDDLELDTGVRSKNLIRASKDVMLTREFCGQKVSASCHATSAAGHDVKQLRSLYVS